MTCHCAFSWKVSGRHAFLTACMLHQPTALQLHSLPFVSCCTFILCQSLIIIYFSHRTLWWQQRAHKHCFCWNSSELCIFLLRDKEPHILPVLPSESKQKASSGYIWCRELWQDSFSVSPMCFSSSLMWKQLRILMHQDPDNTMLDGVEKGRARVHWWVWCSLRMESRQCSPAPAFILRAFFSERSSWKLVTELQEWKIWWHVYLRTGTETHSVLRSFMAAWRRGTSRTPVLACSSG